MEGSLSMMDFYNIGKISEEFKDAWSNEELPAQTAVQLWQAKFLLAIAQQLSVIASHLGKIVRKAGEKQNDEN
jgi:hypothetical protein